MRNNEKNKAEKMIMPRFLRSFHVEADKVGANISVSVGGVISILDFSDTGAIFKVRGGKIKICGDSLSVSVYENNIAEVCGKVAVLEFI